MLFLHLLLALISTPSASPSPLLLEDGEVLDTNSVLEVLTRDNQVVVFIALYHNFLCTG